MVSFMGRIRHRHPDAESRSIRHEPLLTWASGFTSTGRSLLLLSIALAIDGCSWYPNIDLRSAPAYIRHEPVRSCPVWSDPIYTKPGFQLPWESVRYLELPDICSDYRAAAQLHAQAISSLSSLPSNLRFKILLLHDPCHGTPEIASKFHVVLLHGEEEIDSIQLPLDGVSIHPPAIPFMSTQDGRFTRFADPTLTVVEMDGARFDRWFDGLMSRWARNSQIGVLRDWTGMESALRKSREPQVSWEDVRFDPSEITLRAFLDLSDKSRTFITVNIDLATLRMRRPEEKP